MRASKGSSSAGGVRGRIEDSISLQTFSQQPTYRLSRTRLFCIGLFGGLLGMGLCFAVNTILFEISLSRVFAFYFGILFCVLGAIMLLRSLYQPTLRKKLAVLAFSLLVITAGVFSLVFQTEWLWTLHAFTKILIYSVLGIATSFAITFAYLDILSFFHDNTVDFENDLGIKKLGLFESSNQVWLVLAMSIVTGLTYGLTFGLQEEKGLEQAQSISPVLHVDFFVRSLGKSLKFTLPFGCVLGVVGAGVNEYLRHKEIVSSLKKEHGYSAVAIDDDDNEMDGM